MEVDTVRLEENNNLTQLRFEAAVKVIKSLPPDGPFQPSNDMMLKFYSYYKQATVGVCNIPRPGFWDAVGKAKWDAWNSLGEMGKEEAMTGYVDEMKLILEGMPVTDEVEELLRVLGPFYELVEEKKKISQISDLSSGFSTMLNAVPSKSVTKSIVRTMEMNGTLETRPARVQRKELKAEEETPAEDEGDVEDDEEEDEEEEEEDDEEAEEREIRKDKKSAVVPPKKKSSSRRYKVPLSNGKVVNGVHLTNGGGHSRAALNSDDSQEGAEVEAQLNGHRTDLTRHVASDSDSEVYCDSVDQFGQEESSELNRTLDDLEEEIHSQPPADEGQTPPQPVQCGGEDREAGGETTPRSHNPDVDTAGSSLVRRGRGSRSPGRGSGSLRPLHSGGDGDGARWGGGGSPGGTLNEQIVVALARLQEDMQSVLDRLHTLEALTASQARSVALSPTYIAAPVNQRSQRPSWWPFDISPTSLAFAVIWPFVVQWLIRLYLQRRRRRIN